MIRDYFVYYFSCVVGLRWLVISSVCSHCRGDEAGGLGAQAARSEGDGLAPATGSLLDLLDGEVSFGPDHQERLRLGAEEVIDGTALGPTVLRQWAISRRS